MFVNNKGFTLIEVLAVVVIIAVVTLIAMPSVLSIMNSSKDSSYEMMIDNIKTAAGELYQEKDYMNTNIYVYDYTGRTSDVVSIVDSSISVNLQTLVGNGYLTGSNNNDEVSGNTNNKVILEPYHNEDIGMCEIKVTKIKNGNKVCYKVEGSDEGTCPTTADFGGDSQCTS